MRFLLTILELPLQSWQGRNNDTDADSCSRALAPATPTKHQKKRDKFSSGHAPWMTSGTTVCGFPCSDGKKTTCPARNSTQQLLVLAGLQYLAVSKVPGEIASAFPGAGSWSQYHTGLQKDLAQNCWLTNMPTLQRQILVLPTRPVHIGQVQGDTAWSAWPSNRDADVGRGNREVTFRGGTEHRSKLEHNSSRLVSRPTP